MSSFGSRPWAVRLAVGVVVLAAPFLFLGGPTDASTRSFKLAWQLGHPLLFFLVCVLALEWMGRRWRQGWFGCLAVALLGTAVAGAGIEWLQRFAGRESSWSDLRLDLFGAALGVVWAVAPSNGFERFARRTVALVVLGALLVLDLRPLGVALADEALARRAFPVLSDFSTPFEIGRWSSPYPLQVVDAPGGSPGRALRVDLQPDRFAGVRLDWFPRDWRGYNALKFRVFLDSRKGETLTCRIHDLAHDNRFRDRFNRSFPLVPGWNALEIPLADVERAPDRRRMDMGSIASVGCFIARLDVPVRLYVLAFLLQ